MGDFNGHFIGYGQLEDWAEVASVLDMLRQALAECDHRAALYKAMPGYPEKLAEYNAMAVKHGKELLPRSWSSWTSSAPSCSPMAARPARRARCFRR